MARGPIFLSYRRSDSAGHAGRIYDRIATKFPGRVFRDFEALTPGVDFALEIDRRVSTASAMIVVIGPEWVSDRLFEDDDFVRLEVRAALQRKIPTIPVLIGDAQLPKADQLPEDLRALVRRQALSVREDAFDAGMQKLSSALEIALGERAPKPPLPPSSSGSGSGFLAGVAVAVVGSVVVCAGIGWVSLTAIQGEVDQAIEDQLQANTTILPPPMPGPSGVPVGQAFRPVGSWRVLYPNGATAALYVNPDGSFRVDAEINGMVMPAGMGRWNYTEQNRMLALTSVDGTVSVAQITEPHGDPTPHWHAISPQFGAIELWPL